MNEVKKDADRIYFGNEFCENLIPDLRVLKKWYLFSRKEKKDFSFVTPFVTNRGLKKLKELFGFLDSRNGVEVIFNDWGVFYFLKHHFKNLIPVLGRLLTKQRRDPRILSVLLNKQKKITCFIGNNKTKHIFSCKKAPPPTLFEHFQSSIINVPVFQKFLINNGIKRVEIDNMIWKMKINIPAEIGVSVYFPYGYISTTRRCWELTLGYNPCKKECKKYFLCFKDASLPAPFYSIGNTVFYKSRVLSCEELKQTKNFRIVYEPRLPF